MNCYQSQCNFIFCLYHLTKKSAVSSRVMLQAYLHVVCNTTESASALVAKTFL